MAFTDGPKRAGTVVLFLAMGLISFVLALFTEMRRASRA
jgi:hypothetical protein